MNLCAKTIHFFTEIKHTRYLVYYVGTSIHFTSRTYPSSIHLINPFRAAVPFWVQTTGTQDLSTLSPNGTAVLNDKKSTFTRSIIGVFMLPGGRRENLHLPSVTQQSVHTAVPGIQDIYQVN